MFWIRAWIEKHSLTTPSQLRACQEPNINLILDKRLRFDDNIIWLCFKQQPSKFWECSRNMQSEVNYKM